jgi:hypothetical protein
MTLDRELCHCSGADPNCPDCEGTGVVERGDEPVRGSPWSVNLFVPEGLPYHECYPTSHVRCRFCGRRIKRRKIWEHVRQEHPEAAPGGRMKSFYVVQLASTGGMYRDSHLTYGTLPELQQALDFELVSDVREQGYTFAYDNLPFQTYIRGRKKQEINLFPFITIRGANGVAFTAHEKGLWRNFTEQDDGLLLKGTDVVLDDDFWPSALLSIDWGAVPVMPLKGPRLEEGEEAESEDDETFSYGLSDTEAEDDYDAEFRARMDEAFAIDPNWLLFNDGVVRKLAESMHQSNDYSAMSVLADALQEAGCENELLLWHCRSPAGTHARGSWLVERLRRP